MWEEVISLTSTIVLSSEEDALIWQFHSSGLYSFHSLYRVINFRGILPIYLPAVWKLIVPPRVQFFQWLVSKNKFNLGQFRKEKVC
jgi:hypothetical protein